MRYLAEVIQKKGGIIGGSKTEIKLLACQRNEQNWSAVPEESIAAEEANRYSPGTLLMVDLTANKQVQRIEEAGRPLVSILQKFSRSQEKFKTDEEEIEQWKQSLTYQSQELNRREMELEARQEELQQLESNFEQLEQQQQQFEATREAVLQQQEEIERQRQELQGAWDQLQGQKQQLEDRQAELLGACVLDEEKAQSLYQLLDRISTGGTAFEPLYASMQQANGLIHQQHGILSYHWQTLEQQRNAVQQAQQEVDRQVQTLDEQWREWHQAQEALEQAKADIKAQQSVLHMKQAYAQTIGLQIQRYTDLHQQLNWAMKGSNDDVSVQVDIDALEKMPLEELQGLVQNLQRDFEQSSQFVNGQEEELVLKQQEIEALKDKIAQVNEFDRISLEAELADEQDAYQFLNETLVGQRRSLREKEEIARQHHAVLNRRQGKSDPDSSVSGLNLGPVLMQIEAQRQDQEQELQKIEAEIEQIHNAIQEAQDRINSQSGEQDAKRNELKHLEETLNAQRASAAELVGKVALYQEFLQPIQDSVTAMQQQLDAIAYSISQDHESSHGQQQAIDEMRQIIIDLTKKPEFAAV